MTFSKKELKFLREKSFENMVYHFRNELRQIIQDPKKHIDGSALLLKRGIIVYKSVSHAKGGRRSAFLTIKAKKVLRSLS